MPCWLLAPVPRKATVDPLIDGVPRPVKVPVPPGMLELVSATLVNVTYAGAAAAQASTAAAAADRGRRAIGGRLRTGALG